MLKKVAKKKLRYRNICGEEVKAMLKQEQVERKGLSWWQIGAMISAVVFLAWLSTLSKLAALISLLVLVLGLPIYRLIRDKDQFVGAMRMIEIAIWNKPLDKSKWDKKELKNTKVKVNWRKKKNGNTE